MLSTLRKIFNTADILYMDETHYCNPNYNRDLLCADLCMERYVSLRGHSSDQIGHSDIMCIYLRGSWHEEACLSFILSHTHAMQPVAVFMFLATLLMRLCQSAPHFAISQQLFIDIKFGTCNHHRWCNLYWLGWLALSTTEPHRDKAWL